MGDEARPAAVGLQVLQGKHAVFFPDVDAGGGREPSVIYVFALFTLLFGRTLLAMHLPTALGSAGMVFVTFWVGQLFFGRDEDSGRATPWRGLLVGGVGAGLMVVSIGQTILGRTAYNNTTHMPVLLTFVSGTALVGMAGAKLVACHAGRRSARGYCLTLIWQRFWCLSCSSFGV